MLIYEHLFICVFMPDPSESTIAELADLFRLLGDTTRLRIVLHCLHEPSAVGDIAQALGLSPSLVSHHFRLLRAARIVKAQRDGKQVFYLAADQHISDVLEDMLDHIAEPESESHAERIPEVKR
jgi:ArsR family transcriptional regulator, lead/cadmium/zinc/bismuth-responsive transcriptional repressor